MNTPSLVHPDRWSAFLETVLARTWHVVATEGELGPPGTVTPVTLLPGSLDEPILLVNGAELRAFANVCSHRSAPLCATPTSAATLRCPYHGRTFGHDGRCRHAPGFTALTAADDLVPVPLARWGPLIFASVRPAMPFQEVVADLAPLWPARATHDPTGDAEFAVASHALLWMENYLEGLHIPFVHPALSRALDWQHYRTEPRGWSSLQLGPGAPSSPTVRHGDAEYAGVYLALFPTTMVNVYPWGVSLNLVQPRSPASTTVRYRRFVARPELLDVGAGAGLDAVELEDDSIVAAVQGSIRSRFARPARPAGEWELGVGHLHQQLGRLGFGG